MWSLLRRMSSHILSIFGRGLGGWGGAGIPLLAVELVLSACMCDSATALEDSSFMNYLVIGDLINCSLHLPCVNIWSVCACSGARTCFHGNRLPEKRWPHLQK